VEQSSIGLCFQIGFGIQTKNLNRIVSKSKTEVFMVIKNENVGIIMILIVMIADGSNCAFFTCTVFNVPDCIKTAAQKIKLKVL
jgi:hypothetical protein